MLGPVFWMELRTRSRRRRLFAARTLATAGLSTVLAVVYLNFNWGDLNARQNLRPIRTSSGQIVYIAETTGNYKNSIQSLARLGGEIFRAYSVSQFMLLLCIAPVYCAGCVAGDRERRVLELVLLTRLSNSELVAGKFLVRLLELGMLAVTSLPALFFCLLLGGVSWQGLITVGALTLALVAFVASVALLVSIFASRVISAVVLTYAVLLIAWAAIPFIIVTTWFNTAPATGSPAWATIMLHPAMGVANAVFPEEKARGGNPFAGADWWCITFYGIAAVLLLILSVILIRRVGIWASRERVPRAGRKAQAKAARKVWDNPVAWREVKTIAVHRRMRWSRILALIMLITFSAPVWVVYLADFVDGHGALARDLDSYNGVILCTAVIAWLLITLLGSMSFAYERDRSTLDALLTTPLSAAQIVLGKLAGTMRSATFAFAVPLLFIALAVGHQVISLRAGMLGAVIVVIGALLAAAWGLLCSIVTATSTRAASIAFLIALLLAVGIPMLASGTLSWNLQYDFLPATCLSPTVNLSYALYEDSRHEIPNQYYLRQGLPSWSERRTLACMYALIYAGVGGLLVFRSIRQLDRLHRVAPRRSAPTMPAAPPARVSA